MPLALFKLSILRLSLSKYGGYLNAEKECKSGASTSWVAARDLHFAPLLYDFYFEKIERLGLTSNNEATNSLTLIVVNFYLRYLELVLATLWICF